MGAPLQQPGSWSDDERTAFWAFVRGRMAERRLNQEQVAGTLHVDRSVLTRRLNGQIKEQPTENMVADLAAALKLDADGRSRLYQFAGYALPAVAAPPNGVAEKLGVQRPSRTTPPDQGTSRQRRTGRAGAIAAGMAILAMLALAVVLISSSGEAGHATHPTVAATVSPAAITVGGLRLSPADGDTFSGPIHVVARAYSAHPTDPAVAFVHFTLSWDGRPGPWLIICTVDQPAAADVFECTWDPATAGVPAGHLHISFDVFDRSTPQPRVNFAPHGTRTIIYTPPIDRPATRITSTCATGPSCPQLIQLTMHEPLCSHDGRSITWSWSPIAEANNYFLQVSTQGAVNNDVAHSFASADTFNSWLNSATPSFTTPGTPGTTYYALVNWTGPTKLSDGPASEVVTIACP